MGLYSVLGCNLNVPKLLERGGSTKSAQVRRKKYEEKLQIFFKSFARNLGDCDSVEGVFNVKQ